MKAVSTLSGLAALTMAVGLAGAAPAAVYSCEITPAGKSHAVPTDVIVKHDEATGTVLVNDNYIQHFVGEPIAGVLKSKKSNRVLFTWTVPGVKNDVGQYTPGLTFSLNIQLPSGAASITGRPQGYTNDWRGSGTCTVK